MDLQERKFGAMSVEGKHTKKKKKHFRSGITFVPGRRWQRLVPHCPVSTRTLTSVLTTGRLSSILVASLSGYIQSGLLADMWPRHMCSFLYPWPFRSGFGCLDSSESETEEFPGNWTQLPPPKGQTSDDEPFKYTPWRVSANTIVLIGF